MIQKFVINLKLKTKKNANKIQQDIYNLVNSSISTFLDKEIQKASKKFKHTIFIPKIEIQLKSLDDGDYLNQFKNKFISEFRKQLSESVQNSYNKSTRLTFNSVDELDKIDVFTDLSTIKDSEFFALKYFLLKGYFPWWFEHEKYEVKFLIFSFLKKFPDTFFNFIYQELNEKRSKLLRLFNYLNSKESESFFTKVLINRYSKEKKIDKLFLQIAQNEISSEKLKHILLQSMILFSPEKVSKKQDTFIDLLKSGGIEELELNVQGAIFYRLKSELNQEKHSTLIQYIDNLIANSPGDRMPIPETGTQNKKKSPILFDTANEIERLEKKFQDTVKGQENGIKDSKFVKIGNRLVKMPDDNISKVKTNHKQLGLELFTYEFIRDFTNIFLIAGRFPMWALPLITSIKANKRIKNEIDLFEFIFYYLEKHYPTEFRNEFIIIFLQQEISRSVVEHYPESIVKNILDLIYKPKINLFKKFYELIINFRLNKKSLSQARLFEHIHFYFLINYLSIIDEISESTIEILFKKYQKEYENIPTIEELDIQNIESLISLLMNTGVVPVELQKITSIDLEKALGNIENKFLINLFAKPRASVYFITLFPEKIILIVLRKLFGDNFNIINKIWQEHYLIINSIKLPGSHKREIRNLMYQVAIDLLIDVIIDTKIWLQRYYAEMKKFFKIKYPKLDFELHFRSSIRDIQEKRIELYKDFIIPESQFFVATEFPENIVTGDIGIIYFHFEFFLKTGHLHWSFPLSNIAKLAELLILNEKIIIEKYRKEIVSVLNSKNKIQRLFILFENLNAKRFLGTLFELLKYDDSKIVDKLINEEKFDLDELEKKNKEQIKEFFSNQSKDKIYEEIMQEKVDWVNQPADQEKIYVKNAGLLILCNFLSFLFKRTGLIEQRGKKHEFVSDMHRVRAVHLTQYLVNGNEKHQEHELILNKILCGVELQKPINMNISLSEHEKSEADLLLKSVIGHWKILGSTTFDGLRDMFIRRTGVLTFSGNTCNVKVEQKAIDVLLNKLPWTFQTIKLSWTNYVIYVDWNA